jgi:hypothetical protein
MQEELILLKCQRENARRIDLATPVFGLFILFS